MDLAERIAIGLGSAVGLYLLGRGLAVLIRRRYLRLDRPSFANVMSRVIRLGLGFLGVLVAITVIFPSVQPINILSSLGFFSIAVGFAFRDILENLLAGILLLFRAPFRTGDEIEVESTSGTVIEINLRETVLRTYDGRQVLVPNATVYKNPIRVQTGYATLRTEAVVGVAYETDLSLARELALQAVQGTEGVLTDPPPAVLVGELNVSTIDLEVLFWTRPQQANVRRTRDLVLRAVITAYNEAGIEMPADIIVLQGSPSLKAAVRDDAFEPTPGGGLTAKLEQG